MEQLAHFRILSKMGSGGMGEVYRARDEKLQRDVAIKVVPKSQFSDATAKARLFREARAAAGLSHPNICVVHEVGEAGGKAYIAMECVEGETLGARMARELLSHSEALRFAIQLADALAHAHERGVVHRDLKPANVIITPEQRLKVLDFGLARRVDERSSDSLSSTDIMVTKQGVICGTPAYMSPEQLRGSPADERSDLWALGVILHEMLSRERPFEGRTWPELSAAILSMEPRPLPERVPAELKAIIARCLDKEPSSRYQRASEVRSALEVLQSGVISSRAGAREKPRKRKPTAASAARIRVAVLPFVNLTADPENAYLADGITEDLMTEISKVGSLTVVSRTSVMQFRERQQSVKEIAKALRSDVVVEGSVRRAGPHA